MKLFHVIAAFFCIFVGTLGVSSAEVNAGLQPGVHIPSFTLKDQNGHSQTFNSLKGSHGLLILFNRSADWCPFCKAQLIDLEGARHKFEAKGIHVIAITYDSPDILASFAKRKDLHFTMLSDPGSKLIDAFGIRNPEATGYESGVPIPNYYLVDPDGRIRFRYSEATPADRVTANYLYAAIYGAANLPVVARKFPSTPHLNIELSQSDVAVAPGSRIKLLVHAKLNPGEHLYAPGSDQFGYRSVKVVLMPSPLFTVDPVRYPKSTTMHFAALNETVPIFERETLLTVDLTPIRNPNTISHFSGSPDLMVDGSLEYQVCTTSTCFPPTSLPLRWSVHVAASDLDLLRAPDSIRWR
jgi:peroxiredoxin